MSLGPFGPAAARRLRESFRSGFTPLLAQLTAPFGIFYAHERCSLTRARSPIENFTSRTLHVGCRSPNSLCELPTGRHTGLHSPALSCGTCGAGRHCLEPVGLANWLVNGSLVGEPSCDTSRASSQPGS